MCTYVHKFIDTVTYDIFAFTYFGEIEVLALLVKSMCLKTRGCRDEMSTLLTAIEAYATHDNLPSAVSSQRVEKKGW